MPKIAKHVPLVTFEIDEREHHICDILDEIEDAFNDGVKYRYHETYIRKNSGAIVFTLTDTACWQLFRRLVSLKPEKIKSFSVFPFGDLLNGKDAKKLDDSLIEKLIRELIEEFGEDSIEKPFKKSRKNSGKESIEALIENSGKESIKELYEKLDTEIGRLKIEN